LVVVVMVAMLLGIHFPEVVPALTLVDDDSAECRLQPATIVAGPVVVHGDLTIAMLLPPAVRLPLRHVGTLHHDDFTDRLTVDPDRRR
jgi:hypothetical protein